MAEDDYQTSALTTVAYLKRKLVMYPVLKQEFEVLASGYTSIHMGLFCCFFGVLSTLVITLATVPLSEQFVTRFWTVSSVFGMGSLYCGLMAVRDYKSSRKVLVEIRSGTAGGLTDG